MFRLHFVSLNMTFWNKVEISTSSLTLLVPRLENQNGARGDKLEMTLFRNGYVTPPRLLPMSFRPAPLSVISTEAAGGVEKSQHY